MELTEDDVLEIMKLFERSKFDFLQLEHGGRKITLSKGGYSPIAVPAVTPAPTAERAPPDGSAAGTRSLPKAEPVPAAAAGIVVDEGLTAVPAPMVGKFYAAPSPTSPPFVKIGQRVAPDTTIGLIEVMKVFSSVTAGLAGVIERILVGNGQAVEQGQALFLIRPDVS
jgi:acetyl-CoA carboxylase biotin carboxyl carrier protein